ncbi:MAG: DUF2314 domain-containing protein [Planctomycetes bacterium]|nr:DUF2314 domain-containing protein [Planctomycetota bacterium]
MSDSSSENIYSFDGADPEMHQAYERAQSTFRYFWREMAWERRRIIPALNLACVKAPFSDGDQAEGHPDDFEVEHMWISEVDFDGRNVSGTLLNVPNNLKSIAQGDAVTLPLEQISDWMYAIAGEVYGAYTVNLMRSRMSPRERMSHDSAWGLDFGDPTKIRLVPEPKQGKGLLKSWFGKRSAETDEHPMSENMAVSLVAEIEKDKSILTSQDDQGWTVLHHEALAGSAPTVKVLLDAGADPKALTRDGRTALELARSLGWENVVSLLLRR